MTLHTDSRLASEAMCAGASGYLLKHAAAEELIAAIHAVMDGHTYLTPLLTREVLWAIGSRTAFNLLPYTASARRAPPHR